MGKEDSEDLMINLFPTPIKIIKNDSFENNHLIEYCHELSDKIDSGGKNWISKNTYNTSTTYNICGDPNFNQINNWIYNEVDSFVKEIGFEGFDKSKNWGWFNIYNKKDFQEWHNHNFSLVSCIYYLKINKNSAKTFFKNPLPENPNNPKFNSSNPYTWSTYCIEPESDTLVIFKSDLNHCVEQHLDDSTRITLSYNFCLGGN